MPQHEIVLGEEEIQRMTDNGTLNLDHLEETPVETKEEIEVTEEKVEPVKKPRKEKVAKTPIEEVVETLEETTVKEEVKETKETPFWEAPHEEAKVDYEKEFKATKAELELAKQSIDSDPVLKAWLKAKKEGKDPLTSVKNLLLQDPAAVSDDELIAADLMNEEKISKEEAIERVESMDAYLKKRLAKPLKEALSAKHQEQFKEFGFNDYLESQKVPHEIESFATELTSQIEGGTGKKLFNILTQDEKLTKSMLEKVSKGDCFSPTDQNGKYDANVAKLMLLVKYHPKEFFGELAKSFEDKGRREALQEKQADRPIVSGGQGLAASKLSREEIVKDKDTVWSTGKAV